MKNSLVVKSNKLIQARYKLNLNEQKIILYAVSKLDRDKDKFNILQIKTNEFIKLLNTSEFRYTEIRDLVSELMKKQVRIKTEKSDLVVTWVSSIEYLNNLGIIELEFSEKLIPYLLQLKSQFTRYELKNILSLKNKHSIRIYELLKQYQVIGKREFKIEELKEILFIEGQYERIYDFKRFVLDATKEEINEYTDINIDYDDIKKGRKIIGFIFKIRSKDQEKKIYIEYLNEFYDIKEMQNKMGLSEENFNSKQIIEIYIAAVQRLENEEEKDIFEYIRLNYLNIKDKARSKYAYLLKALEEDYASAILQINLDYYFDKKD